MNIIDIIRHYGSGFATSGTRQKNEIFL